jgi:hypothetical protein
LLRKTMARCRLRLGNAARSASATLARKHWEDAFSRS